MKQDMILVLDLGSQENPRLAREIRSLGVYSEIHPHDITLEQVHALPNVKGIIVNGGPNRIVDGVEIDVAKEIYNCELPVLVVDHKGEDAWPEDQADRIEALANFIFGLCQAEPNWNMENFIADQVELIRRQVGDKKVLLALSGGVDSSVVAALLIRAIGKQLTCVHVNHGLLRKGEPEQVEEVFTKQFDVDFIHVHAEDRYAELLAGVTEPEEKRRIIGTQFWKEFFAVAQQLETDGKPVKYLAQGTIYPDVVESGLGGESTVIKSHHNVGGLPDTVDFKELVEPLRNLFKDEVRQAGRELGLPEYLVSRQPFPGPGLGIRIIGEVTPEKVTIVQDADAIWREEIAKAGLDKEISQYYAALTNMHSVGVMGDERTYDYAVALRAVTTTDFMTAESYDMPWDVLGTVTSRIVNEVKHVNRVFYDCTGKPPATIELE